MFFFFFNETFVKQQFFKTPSSRNSWKYIFKPYFNVGFLKIVFPHEFLLKIKFQLIEWFFITQKIITRLTQYWFFFLNFVSRFYNTGLPGQCFFFFLIFKNINKRGFSTSNISLWHSITQIFAIFLDYYFFFIFK